MKQAGICFILFFLPVLLFSSQDYYVNDGTLSGDVWCSAVGASGNDGLSTATPKNSIMGIITNYKLYPGDIVYVDTGTYNEKVVIGTNDRGNTNNVLSFIASSNGAVIDSPTSGSEADSSIALKPGHYLKIKGFRLTGSYAGIFMWNDSKHNLIQGNYIYKNTTDGIKVGRPGSDRAYSNIIYANQCFSNDGNGIYLSSPNELWKHGNLVSRNNCFDNKVSGILVYYSDYNLISQNILEGNNISGSGGGALNLDGNADYNVIEYNTLFSNKLWGFYVASGTGTILRNCISVGHQRGYEANSALSVTYSVSHKDAYNGASVNGGNFLSGTGCMTNNPNFGNMPNDLWLKFDSPLIDKGTTNKAKSSIGRFAASVTPVILNACSSTTHTNSFVTTYAGSIPKNGNIMFKYPSSFSFGTLAVTTTSRWGGTPGTFSVTALGDGLIRISRGNDGTSSTPGEAENLIISGIVNSSSPSNRYRISFWTTTSNGDMIDFPDESNEFRITNGACVSPSFSLSKNILNILPGGSPVPGAAIEYRIKCSNTSGSTLSNLIVVDKLPAYAAYITNGVTFQSGWTNSIATNPTPVQTYESSDYFQFTNLLSNVRWVRWKKKYMNLNESAEFIYRVVIK